MGGHGGLNILPQKRWNVYNRDNRLKVARDEAKAKAEEDAARERHEGAEREHRHHTLLQRATAGDALVAAGGPGAAGDVTAATVAGPAPLEHINFWKDEEAHVMLQQHPEVEKQKKDELRNRGNPDTYTMDAKFDERFKLGYEIGGDKPWYARPPSPTRRQLQQAGTAAPAAALPAAGPSGRMALPAPADKGAMRLTGSGKRRRRHSPSPSRSSGTTSSSSSSSSSSSGSSGDEAGSSSDDSSTRRRERRRQRRREERKKGSSSKHKRDRKRHKASGKSSSSSRRREEAERQAQQQRPAGKSLEQLRAERLLRERQEAQKARVVLAGAYNLEPQGPAKEYNSAYGFAAANNNRRPKPL